MTQDEVLDKINSKRTRNFSQLYELISEIHEHVAGDWSDIFMTSSPYSKFQNIIRNLSGRNIIKKPLKPSKELLFAAQHVLQILVVKNYRTNSVPYEAVKKHIQFMSKPMLIDLLFIKVPPYCEKLINQYKADKVPQNEGKVKAIIGTRYIHISAGKGITLQIQDGLYDDVEINKMVDYLKKKSR